LPSDSAVITFLLSRGYRSEKRLRFMLMLSSFIFASFIEL